MTARPGRNAALVIPCRDEEDCIGDLVREAKAVFAGPIIVSDNGSRDATAAVAQEAGAIVVSEPTAGYGRACLAGIRAVPEEIGVIVLMDGDGSDRPSDIAPLLTAIEAGADFALGVRRGRGVAVGSIAPAARFGNWLCGWLIWICWRRRLHDLSPLKAVRVDALRRIDLHELTYGFTVELLALAVARRFAITEVTVGYRMRAGGVSKVSGDFRASVKAGYRILWTIGRVARREGVRWR